MTAPMPLEDFTDDQTRRLAAIEAAQEAPESLRERVAVALWKADEIGNCPPALSWEGEAEQNTEDYRRLADAAIAVIAGEA